MKVYRCWPTKWLEAAQKVGFAIYKGDGEFEFINDLFRDKLEQFAMSITEEYVNERPISNPRD